MLPSDFTLEKQQYPILAKEKVAGSSPVSRSLFSRLNYRNHAQIFKIRTGIPASVKNQNTTLFTRFSFPVLGELGNCVFTSANSGWGISSPWFRCNSLSFAGSNLPAGHPCSTRKPHNLSVARRGNQFLSTLGSTFLRQLGGWDGEDQRRG
jgi:hypothetical protein